MCAIDFGNSTMDDDEKAIAERISELKLQLGEDLLILGHHYQRDQIVMHADLLGDSFLLSEMAAASKAKNIVFCGVHFMAESADILTDDDQIIILPNLRAGCSMAATSTTGNALSATTPFCRDRFQALSKAIGRLWADQ